MTKVET